MSLPRPTSVASWLVLAAGVTELALLAAIHADIPGPWRPAALVAAIVTVLCAGAVVFVVGREYRRYIGAQARAAIAESERDSLRRDLQHHDQLEQALMQAKQTAESAVLAKGEFLATMSHEIRTPLNGIVPMLDMLARAPLAPDYREILNTANASSHQLLRIVDDILDYSKLEANKLELEITTFNLRELLDGVLQLMQRPAQNKTLRLDLQLDPAVRLPVRGDPLRLRQILSNLLGNAIKFTDRGGITLAVRRLGETPTQHLLRFEVRDTGIGIPADVQARLFSSFTQADASTTRLYGGTGLGLAICKRIVELMGGRINVMSEPQRGSTFWFELPLTKIVGDMKPHALHQLPQNRVLVITTDPRLRQRLELLLGHWSMQATCVETTQEALECLRTASEPPDNDFIAVLADLGSLRASARALHRALTRPAHIATAPRLVWLYNDHAVPEELRSNSTFMPRQSLDISLRLALLGHPLPPPEPWSPPQTGTETPQPADHPPPLARQAPAPSSLPAAAPQSEPAKEHPAPHTTSDKTGHDAASPRARLLLVEDNPVNLLVAQKLLAALGFDCESELNGQLALDRLMRESFDLVLMDCQMPVLDGYDATRTWRIHEQQQSGQPRLPIIAMTANAMPGDRQRCLDAGMDDYLAKPVTREQLETCLRRWLPGRPPAPSLPTLVPSVTTNTQEHWPDSLTPMPMARPTTPTFPVLDYSLLDELHQIAGAETVRIISLFLEDAPRLITTLEKAAALPDLDAIRNAAHTLKSSSANVGAMALSMAAKRMELGAHAARMDRPAVAVALIIAEYARARMALLGYATQHLGSLPMMIEQTDQSSSIVNK